MSALQAIALAGYANHTAAVGRSRLVRETPNGVQETNLNVGAMQKGKMPDVTLLPDDVVYVPFSFVRNLEVNSQGILASATSAALYIH
jgi:polysaccharide export outer membrane protein